MGALNLVSLTKLNQGLEVMGLELRQLRRGGVLANKELFLTEREAAEYLGIQPATLRKWRTSVKRPPKDQPKYTKVGGRVRYTEREIKHYIERNTKK